MLRRCWVRADKFFATDVEAVEAMITQSILPTFPYAAISCSVPLVIDSQQSFIDETKTQKKGTFRIKAEKMKNFEGLNVGSGRTVKFEARQSLLDILTKRNIIGDVKNKAQKVVNSLYDTGSDVSEPFQGRTRDDTDEDLEECIAAAADQNLCADFCVQLPGYEGPDLVKIVFPRLLKVIPHVKRRALTGDFQSQGEKRLPSYQRAHSETTWATKRCRLHSDYIDLSYPVDILYSRNSTHGDFLSRRILFSISVGSSDMTPGTLSKCTNEIDRVHKRTALGLSAALLQKRLPKPILETVGHLQQWNNACYSPKKTLPPIFWASVAAHFLSFYQDDVLSSLEDSSRDSIKKGYLLADKIIGVICGEKSVRGSQFLTTCWGSNAFLPVESFEALHGAKVLEEGVKSGRLPQLSAVSNMFND